MNDTKKIIEQLRNYIAGARAAARYSIGSCEGEDQNDYVTGYTRGYQEGQYAAYEGALGLLELIEEQSEYNVI